MTGTATTRMTKAELLERLGGFDTTRRNSNLAPIGFIRDYLDVHGVTYRIGSDAAGQKANLHTLFAQAHQPDEWIAQTQLDSCDRFIRGLVDRLLV